MNYLGVIRLAFHPNSSDLLAALGQKVVPKKQYSNLGINGIVMRWSATSGKNRMSKAFITHRGGVRGVVFDPKGRWFASSGYDGVIKIWDAQTNNLLKTIVQSHTPFLKNAYGVSIAVREKGDLLASGGDDGKIHLWNTKTWQKVRTITTPLGGGVELFCFAVREISYFHPQTVILECECGMSTRAPI